MVMVIGIVVLIVMVIVLVTVGKYQKYVCSSTMVRFHIRATMTMGTLGGDTSVRSVLNRVTWCGTAT
jgi:hypothetical protein